MTLPKVYTATFPMGCDPELFLRKDGEVIGSEKVIPETGLGVLPISGYGHGKFIRDGVQLELNPKPYSCRANLGNELKVSFATLRTELGKHAGLTADFSRTVLISEKNLMDLDEKSRVFGCQPSLNVYQLNPDMDISKVNPLEYRVRSAGGHIHLGHVDSSGYSSGPAITKALTEDAERTVQMLDIVCGNTCILVDRDESNAERRKVYGRAGEYRRPKHGLEYRTLSNFWLTAYPLMSLAFSLARLSVQLMASTTQEEYYKAFTSAVKQENIIKAINTNDFNLAVDNFMAIEQLLKDVTYNADSHGICENNMLDFHHFVNMISDHGLKYWFKEDPLHHWANLPEGHGCGFGDFLRNNVAPDRQKQQAA